MNEYGPPRPATIEVSSYAYRCGLCGDTQHRPTYQEASIALTRHLGDFHPGWIDYEDAPPEENFWDDRTTPGRNG